MTRKEIFDKVYDCFINGFVFKLPSDIANSEEAKLVKDKVFEVVLKSSKSYKRENINTFRKREEILQEVVFQSIIIYTFFLVMVPNILVPETLIWQESKLLQ